MLVEKKRLAGFWRRKTLVLGEKNSSRDVASVTQKCLLLSDYI